MPSRPISPAVQTPRVISVVDVVAPTAVWILRAPPFSIASRRPVGRNPTPVGWLSPPSACVSTNPLTGVPALAVAASPSASSSPIRPRNIRITTTPTFQLCGRMG